MPLIVMLGTCRVRRSKETLVEVIRQFYDDPLQTLTNSIYCFVTNAQGTRKTPLRPRELGIDCQI